MQKATQLIYCLVFTICIVSWQGAVVKLRMTIKFDNLLLCNSTTPRHKKLEFTSFCVVSPSFKSSIIIRLMNREAVSSFIQDGKLMTCRKSTFY